MKKISTLLILVFMASMGFSQIKKVWDKDIASGDLEDAVLVYKNPDKTIDVIAKIRNSGNDVTIGYGQHDYWFGKLNASGQVISNFTYGGTDADFCKSAVKTTDGGYLIVGVSQSGANGLKTDAIPAGNANVLWIIKIDTAGQLQWQKQQAFNGFGSGTSSVDFYKGPVVCNTSSGYAIVCITSFLNTSGQRSYSTYTIPLDFSGNLSSKVSMTVPTYPQNNPSYTQANLYINYVYQLSNGNLMALGWGYKNAVLTKRIALAIELTSNGIYIGHNEYTSSGDCELISGKELSPNGNRLVFARSKHDNSLGYTRTLTAKSSLGNSDIWVFKTNNIGTNLFDQRAIGCGADNLPDYFVIQNSRNVHYRGNIAYLILDANGVGFDKTENPRGLYDYWFVNYNFSTNQIVNEKTLGGSSYETAQSIFSDGQDAYLFGDSDSPISGDKTEAVKSGSGDLWLVKVCLTADAPAIANTFPFFATSYKFGCGGYPTTFFLSNPNPDYTYTWYDAATNGNIVGNGTSYTTPILGDGQILNAWVEPNNGPCKGARVAVTARALRTPKKPSITGSTILCKGNNVFLVANKDTAIDPGHYNISCWYDSTGTNLISVSDTIKFLNVQQGFKLFLSTIDSLPGYAPWSVPEHICESQKFQINILIDEPPLPIVNFIHPNCNYSVTTLTVTNSSNDTVKWYDTSNNLAYTGNPFIYSTTKIIDTVYVKLKTVNLCESALKEIILDVSAEKPIALFNSLQILLNPGDVIQFSNQSINGLSYYWDFGDLSYSTQTSPWHYFYNPGFYTIKLITTAPNGCKDTLIKTNYISVSNYTGIKGLTISNDIKIFPNPFNESLEISLPVETKTVTITLVNQLGEIILLKELNASTEINTENLPKGLYFLQIRSGDRLSTTKLLHE